MAIFEAFGVRKFDLHVVYPAVQTNEGHVIKGTDITIPLCAACTE